MPLYPTYVYTQIYVRIYSVQYIYIHIVYIYIHNIYVYICVSLCAALLSQVAFPENPHAAVNGFSRRRVEATG